MNKYRIYVPSLVVMELLQGAKIIQKAMGLAIPDAIIASVAIERKLPLYTLNVKDFNFISGLKLLWLSFSVISQSLSGTNHREHRAKNLIKSA